MKVGSLVEHKTYFGVGIVIDIRRYGGEPQWKIHWLREGKNFGWAYVNLDIQHSVEIICK